MVANHHSADFVRLFNRTKRSWPPFDGAPSKTVLFATDLSDSSRIGLTWATRLARTRQARLLIVHVAVPPKYEEGLLYGPLSLDRFDLKAALGTFVPSDPRIPVTHRVLFGDPASEIVRIAEQEHVSLIVLGTHQRSGLRRLLTGSVAESVLRRAPCPVFAFRQVSGE